MMGESLENPIDRSPFRTVRRLWYGKTLQPPTYHIAGALFVRLLGVVYLIAIVSLWTQVSGLVGDHGILPVADFLDAVRQHFAVQTPPSSPFWSVPTLLWISPHDGLLHLLCAAGTLLSLMLIAGVMPMPSLVLLWVCYLSLFHAGQVFLSFQWDILLLEAGFVAIFVAPSAWRSKFLADPHPPKLALFLVWWLLFRIMLESGAVKLTWNDWQTGLGGAALANTWESLTALDYHYWTQPLPLWTSWYAAQLPHWFQRLSVVGVFLVELLLPWFIFGPRRLRLVAFAGIASLMSLISVTGNYNFFNLLTGVLALTLLDDRAWPQFLRRRIVVRDGPPPRRGRRLVLVPFAVWAIVLGVLQVMDAVSPGPRGRLAPESELHVAQFLWVNDYGLFRRMTETRPELIIEGTADQVEWKPYEFRWKPGDPSRAPRLAEPHQPRLDWQMWFEALQWEAVYEAAGSISPRSMSPWFRSFVVQLLKGEPQVLDLLAANPFPDAPPRFVRVVLYQYQFTSRAERDATGDWWHRERVWVGPTWSAP